MVKGSVWFQMLTLDFRLGSVWRTSVRVYCHLLAKEYYGFIRCLLFSQMLYLFTLNLVIQCIYLTVYRCVCFSCPCIITALIDLPEAEPMGVSVFPGGPQQSDTRSSACSGAHFSLTWTGYNRTLFTCCCYELLVQQCLL